MGGPYAAAKHGRDTRMQRVIGLLRARRRKQNKQPARQTVALNLGSKGTAMQPPARV